MKRLLFLIPAFFLSPPFTMTVGEQITTTQSAVSSTAVSSSAVKPTEKPKKSRKAKKAKRAKTEVFKVTAYCPCHECSGDYGRQTATGHTARAGHTIAVDPTVIQYGTHVKINGVEYVAEDCGGAVKGNTIDIFFDTHEETEDFGVQYLEVEVMR